MPQTINLSGSEDPLNRKSLSAISLAVAKAKRVVIITGAGISCSCGIPDFRSTDGLYNLVKAKYPNAVVKGRDLFDASLFRDPNSTAVFYTFISGLKTAIDGAQPSPTHRFIKTLDVKGKLLRSYTQNIDGLEERVGLVGTTSESVKKAGKGKLKVNDVRNVLLHGDIHRVRCTVCSASMKCEESHLGAFRNGSPPDCPECLTRSAARVARSARALTIGTLRPAIVLYDEPHPLGDEIGAIETRDLGRKPDLLIIMGTSLKVHGLKKLVKEFATAVHEAVPSTSSASSSKTPPSRGLLNKVIFVNKTAPGSEWAGVIDYHVEGTTDEWVEKVTDDWRKMRPADWEIQTTLADMGTRVIKDVPKKSNKVITAGKKPLREGMENIDPTSRLTQGKKPYAAPRPGPASRTLPYALLAASKERPMAPLRAGGATHAVSAPIPLSPSKRANRTYTTAAGVTTQCIREASTSSSSGATQVEAMYDSDEEAPEYDSESERSSPRKKRRAPEDMSIDEIDPVLLDIRPQVLFPATAFTR